ncbi:MAG TPA: NADH-quinone oxidoreductase subunit J [Vicinamibacterales bacterium]|nr:NADH-quinone oxidoreductase subunit J [Vicinamibacterales bacterium]
MNVAFNIAGGIAVVATLLAITRSNAVHALLYLVVSLLAVALDFLLLGAAFVAALEVIIYAGAIVVLFVFVVMMLNLGPEAEAVEQRWLTPRLWLGPTILAGLLILEIDYLLTHSGLTAFAGSAAAGPHEVGLTLFGPYLIGVELASMLLLAGLVGAYHVGRQVTAAKEGRDGVGSAH